MSDQPYQLLPPLAPDETAALRESIATFGVLHPVIVDEAGQIIDGHHRAAIADGLGIVYRTVVLPGLSEEQKLEQALALNLARRHLDAEQKRQLVADLRARGLSVRWIGEATGIPRTTVHRLAGGVPNGTPEYVTGKDGKHYRAQAPMPTEAEADAIEARRFARDLMERGLDEHEVGPLTIDELHTLLTTWPPGAPIEAAPGVPIARDDPALPEVLYEVVVERAAKALLRSGRLVRRPDYIRYPGKSQRRRTGIPPARGRLIDDVNEENIWAIMVKRRAGGFLNWCDKAGVDLLAKPPKVPDPLDLYVLGGLYLWLRMVPHDVAWADVLTDDQRRDLQETIDGKAA